MIDLTPLDVRKKKGDFRRRVRGYEPQLVDDFLDLVAERLEEVVKQNVELSERARQLQEQVASFRERERALNEALVAAQELREQSRANAEREADLVRREAEAAADRILEEGQRALREVKRQFEALENRKASFLRAFKSLLERHLAELEVEETRLGEAAGEPAPRAARPAAARNPAPAPSKPVPSRGSLDPTLKAPRDRRSPPPTPEADPDAEPESESTPPKAAAGSDNWLSALFREGQGEA